MDQIKNTSSSLKIDWLEGKIDRRHHPLLVLRESEDYDTVEQVVVCRGAKLQKTINQFLSGKWVVETRSYSRILERKVVSCLKKQSLAVIQSLLDGYVLIF